MEKEEEYNNDDEHEEDAEAEEAQEKELEDEHGYEDRECLHFAHSGIVMMMMRRRRGRRRRRRKTKIMMMMTVSWCKLRTHRGVPNSGTCSLDSSSPVERARTGAQVRQSVEQHLSDKTDQNTRASRGQSRAYEDEYTIDSESGSIERPFGGCVMSKVARAPKGSS